MFSFLYYSFVFEVFEVLLCGLFVVGYMVGDLVGCYGSEVRAEHHEYFFEPFFLDHVRYMVVVS